jgi:hypothetical protein
VKKTVPRSSSSSSLTMGIANLSFTILLFNALQSTQKRQDPSCFLTSNTGTENANELSRIIPW